MKFPLQHTVKLLAAIFVSLAFTTAGHAADTKKPKLKPKPLIPYMAIASVDTKAMTITIQAKNSTATTSKTYKFTAQTKVSVNGHDGTMSDLKPGLQIRVGTGLDEGTADELTASNPPADPNPKK